MSRVFEAAAAAVGLPLIPLRLLVRELDAERRPTLMVLEAEPLEAAAAGGPPLGGARAPSAAASARPASARPWTGGSSAVATARTSRDPGTAPPGPDPAGTTARRSWMVDRMAEAGRPAEGPPTTIYAWPLAVVLRAPAAGGPCFLKCAAPVFAHEASITSTLAERTPDLVPEVIAHRS